MRPDILFPLFSDIIKVDGVGPRTAEMLEKSVGRRVRDLVLTPPTGLIERTRLPSITSASNDTIATLKIVVGTHRPSRTRKQPYKIPCTDESGDLTVAFFHARADYLRKILPEGAERIISGKIERYHGHTQMPHPDYVVPISDERRIPEFETTYPLTAGLSQKMMRKAIEGAFLQTPILPEWQSASMIKSNDWPSWHDALKAMHYPQSKIDAGADTQSRKRLAYDELLAKQLALALARENTRKQSGRSFIAKGEYVKEVLQAAPFTPTNAQTRTYSEIATDLSSTNRMARLLQGDVGAGKTFVAALASAHVCETGAQVAIMAPTEILARQHQKSLSTFLGPANLTVEALTGRDKGPQRKAILRGLAEGHIDVICGTHALFQESVDFHDLGLAIIDEQHRFGVRDRLALSRKGSRPDLLVMTATPIPRTLALTSYGDLDISILDEKPKGRKPIETRIVPIEKMQTVINGLQRVLDKGEQVYWVCPLVEDSELVDLSSAEKRFRHLNSIFGDRVGLLHGKMKAQEKEAISENFKRGGIDILVATTVIEVGVDAPGATIMVIEHAERFGLAQLHQLRGRVGRSHKQSACILLYKGPLGVNSKARLSVLRETEDGFLIAEEDWKLRGSGDLLGARQSGLPNYKLADLDKHKNLLEMAVKDARLFVDTDAKLETPRGAAVRILLYLFEQDVGIAMMKTA
ncbi:MAG: ATP-dependent DNA helicase RecG [Robiginitomaculum sp.]